MKKKVDRKAHTRKTAKGRSNVKKHKMLVEQLNKEYSTQGTMPIEIQKLLGEGYNEYEIDRILLITQQNYEEMMRDYKENPSFHKELPKLQEAIDFAEEELEVFIESNLDSNSTENAWKEYYKYNAFDKPKHKRTVIIKQINELK